MSRCQQEGDGGAADWHRGHGPVEECEVGGKDVQGSWSAYQGSRLCPWEERSTEPRLAMGWGWGARLS